MKLDSVIPVQTGYGGADSAAGSGAPSTVVKAFDSTVHGLGGGGTPAGRLVLRELLAILADLLREEEPGLCLGLIKTLVASTELAATPLAAPGVAEAYRAVADLAQLQEGRPISSGVQALQRHSQALARHTSHASGSGQGRREDRDAGIDKPRIHQELVDDLPEDALVLDDSTSKPAKEADGNLSHIVPIDSEERHARVSGDRVSEDHHVIHSPSQHYKRMLVGLSGSVRGTVALKATPCLPGPEHGSARLRYYVLFTDPSQSLLGKFIDVIVLLTILASSVALMLESEPEYRHRSDECLRLKNSNLQLTVEACEPVPNNEFKIAEVVSVVIFTIEYFSRTLSVHAMTDESCWTRARGTFLYATRAMNVVDLLAILPFYANAALSGSGVPGLRLLRLLRVLRLFKVVKYLPETQLFADTLVMSFQPLLILVFFNSIIVVLFASLIYQVENEAFSVAAEFTNPRPDNLPWRRTGVWVRTDQSFTGQEVTPFRSIPYCMWWVCTTMTTVGYGDLSPTTRIGKVIGVATFYVGIIFLALPITVLGTNFGIVYNKHIRGKKAKGGQPPPMPRSSRLDPGDLETQTSPTFQNLTQRGPMPLFPVADSWRKQIFLLWEEPSASKVGNYISMLVAATIVASTLAFIMETMPDFSITPSECNLEALTVDDCTPRPHPMFGYVEIMCIIIFTVDYVCKVSTVHTAKPSECGIKDPDESSSWITFRYCTQWLNLIDLLAIAPFYVQLLMGGHSDLGGFAILRVLRLVRMLRILKQPKMRLGAAMLMRVVVDCIPALVLLLSLSMLMCVLLASCIVFAESSHYSVDPEWLTDDTPYGVYIRPTKDGYMKEVSPFRSIPYAFWWFFTTATTVGYGDDFPTTTVGRIVGMATFYIGIILLALPITIIGEKFNCYYPEWLKAMGIEFQDKDEKKPGDSDKDNEGRPVNESKPTGTTTHHKLQDKDGVQVAWS